MTEKTIWKYSLQLTDLQSLSLPQGAEILTVQAQGGGLYLWAIVDPARETEERVIGIIGTGNPVITGGDIDRRYIATVQRGSFVWHVFERR